MYSSRNMVVITELDEVSVLLSKFSMSAIYLDHLFVFFFLFLLLALWLLPGLDFDVTFSESLELFLSCMYSLSMEVLHCIYDKIQYSVIGIKSSKLYMHQSKAERQQADSTNSQMLRKQALRWKGVRLEGITLKGIALQKGITRNGITLKGVTRKGINFKGITRNNDIT